MKTIEELDDSYQQMLNLYYWCPDCAHAWDDQWSCEVDSECGCCGKAYTPFPNEHARLLEANNLASAPESDGVTVLLDDDSIAAVFIDGVSVDHRIIRFDSDLQPDRVTHKDQDGKECERESWMVNPSTHTFPTLTAHTAGDEE